MIRGECIVAAPTVSLLIRQTEEMGDRRSDDQSKGV
jgi:hypothetical protein